MKKMALWEKMVLWFLAIIVLLIAFLVIVFYSSSYIANRPNFTIQELPEAHLNQPYYAKIEIEAAIIEEAVDIQVSNEDIMVEPKVYESHKDIYNKPVYRADYSNLTITGTPSELKPITIKLTGSTYGSMFVGKEFEKTYTIEVLE
ncbi:hypothetical protein [Moraxella equi]|uniref:Uncharacterized protein n=1 Tax=Moraxella equi TaxID=60442 RepID=A0A378QTF1_9GAMM|nr:hypothetical protein [Moraxella equi]OPH37902.1 hypothetical protein B5J93_07390 [Moraxella equi]STZ03564.1 Uncharacterised protein [Moraxella equi]